MRQWWYMYLYSKDKDKNASPKELLLLCFNIVIFSVYDKCLV